MNQTAQSQLILDKIVESGVKLTPMMEQYYEIKKAHKETLLMFRMGDFYELFFEDAQIASKILNISLTHRGKLGETKIPMAGIPHHAASTYIDRITSEGKKVAICEQVEDPKAAKGIVKRAVTQVVSPGMPFDLDKSESTAYHFMGCAFETIEGIYLILIDYTTGDFIGQKLGSIKELIEKITLFQIKEFIASLGQWEKEKELLEVIDQQGILLTHLSEEYFQEKYTSIYIEKLIPTYKRDEILKLYHDIICPIGALSYYICSTQDIDTLSHIKPFQMLNADEGMKITHPTLVGLEIFPKNKNEIRNSILGHFDKTMSAMGSRQLKILYQSPLKDADKINERLNTVEELINDQNSLGFIRSELEQIRDIERIMAKLSSKKINAGDLIALKNSFKAYFNVQKNIKRLPLCALKNISTEELSAINTLMEEIEVTISDEIGASLEKGNLIKAGRHKERDRLAQLTYNASDSLLALEAKYREETGIPNLRVKSNNVAGYFIEISKSHLSKVPEHFTRRQTLVNSERYQSEELAEFEKEMISAKDKLYHLEREIFNELITNVSELAASILNLAFNLAQLDIFQSFAWSAIQFDLSRPEFSIKKLIDVDGGWHPLIKHNLQDQFVTHNLILDSKNYFGLITGPNMAGKTTVMREMAIIQFLSQLGSFVPANKAVVSPVDYLFSRLGAHDDIVKGQSTFMVEMSETAEILRHATENSLIILDEIGRGTSTYDGMSIAWSLVEHFVNITKAKTLFSTHYHELINLVDDLKYAKNFTVKTKSKNGEVQFLYELIEEGATQSFGIHVAKMAGLPSTILQRSNQILKSLESEAISTTPSSQLDFFSSEKSDESENEHNELIEEIKSLDITNLTPMQALNLLDNLRTKTLN